MKEIRFNSAIGEFLLDDDQSPEQHPGVTDVQQFYSRVEALESKLLEKDRMADLETRVRKLENRIERLEGNDEQS